MFEQLFPSPVSFSLRLTGKSLMVIAMANSKECFVGLSGKSEIWLPSGELTFCNGKSPFFYGNIHYKWPFSIAMLVHQRVPHWRVAQKAMWTQRSLGSLSLDQQWNNEETDLFELTRISDLTSLIAGCQVVSSFHSVLVYIYIISLYLQYIYIYLFMNVQSRKDSHPISNQGDRPIFPSPASPFFAAVFQLRSRMRMRLAYLETGEITP